MPKTIFKFVLNKILLYKKCKITNKTTKILYQSLKFNYKNFARIQRCPLAIKITCKIDKKLFLFLI